MPLPTSIRSLAFIATAFMAGMGSHVSLHAQSAVVRVEEGTNYAVRQLPGGSFIVDLQGSIWTLASDGGTLHRITTDQFDFSEPDVSPDGLTLAVQGYTGRGFRLFSMAPDGSELRQISQGPGEQRQPRWSPDGRHLAYVSTRDRERPEIWVRELASGVERQLTRGEFFREKSALAWRPDGRAISFVDGNRIRTVSISDGRDLDHASADGITPSAMSWSPDGTTLAYVADAQLWIRQGTGGVQRVGTLDDVFPFAPQWLSADELLYTANGKVQISRIGRATRSVPFEATFEIELPDYKRKAYDFSPGVQHPVKGIVTPTLSPDGRYLLYRALGGIWLQPIGGEAQQITTEPAWYNDPSWSPDGRKIAYVSDVSDGFQLHLYDVASRRHEQLTRWPGPLERPFWSPDGREIAFFDASGESGHDAIWAIDLASRKHRKVAALEHSGGKASWSPDGRTIVYAATDAAPFMGGRTGYFAISVSDGIARYHQVASERSITTRADNGPVWSPDGRSLLFVMESTLWTIPIEADGTPAGAPVQISNEIADAPTWTSSGILYLNNARLRLLEPDAEAARTIETGLTWSRPVKAERFLIHAGALWDGASPELQHNVDITIEGSRIISVEPHDASRHSGLTQIVDASDLTVVPGLIDGHVHVGSDGLGMGRKLGPLYLSFGITTMRSTGGIAYRLLEDSEARSAGIRVAPRLFWAGEMIDGTRQSNAQTHPVESEGQLALELSRIQALDYDFVKVYRFFPSAWQKRLIKTVQSEIGIPVTSHYLHPNVAYGLDQLEHLGGPTRWGMDHNHIRSHGHIYADVFDTIVKSGIFVTTTNFASSIHLADDPGLASDPRVQAFLSAADRHNIVTELACAQGTAPCGTFLQPDAEQSARTATVLSKLVQAGANIVAGTDSPYDAPAVSLHLNLRSLQDAGLTSFQVLQSATVRPAQMLNVEHHLGTVEPGKLADLIMVRGDPSKDVRHLADVEIVVTDGRVFRPQEWIDTPAPRPLPSSKPSQ